MVAAVRVLDILNESEEQSAAFLFSSGLIAVSTINTDTGILYIKNTLASPLIMDTMVLSSNNLVAKWKLFTSPTTGTLISAGTALVPVNADLASARPAVGTFLYGVNGATVTNGSSIFLGVGVSSLRFDAGMLGLILRTGGAIALVADVPASALVSVFVAAYYKDLE
jgi:hypothetical protein